MERVRTTTPNRPPKLCHGGTLDPFAHGLLLILVGQATKLFDHLHAIPKTYVTTVKWGLETDNGDPLGKPSRSADASHLTPEALDSALTPFIGWHDQVPHATSAKRIDGERAYERAHRGETVMMPPSRVYLYSATWLSHDLPHVSTLMLVVRGGFYVRALARDLARSLDTAAHLSTLHRTAIGPYTDPGPDKESEAHGHDLLPWAASRELTDNELGALRKSEPIATGTILAPTWPLPTSFPDPEAPIRAFHRDRLMFLLRPDHDRLRGITTFPGGL
jgi:tRNA pseudouridine55 synthase